MSRPALPAGERRVMIVVRMSPALIERLDALAEREGVSRARMMEHLVERARERPSRAKKTHQGVDETS